MENDSQISAKDIHEKLLSNEDVSKCMDLSAFVALAENFNAKNSDLDIVKNYLHVSTNCKEILQLVKGISTVESQMAMLILNSLCHILVRIAKDLHSLYLPVGTSIVNDILDFAMKSILNFLKIKQKSSRTKMALHLLCSMVALGGQTAHKVVSKLDFSNLVFTHLLNRKNFSEEEDIRSAFINLIVLILTTCDSAVIRQLVEVKGFLNDVLHGLESDRPYIITLVLSTFRKLIVESTGISKTSKLKLFNDHSLKPVIKLYSWKGPVKNKKQKKRKLGEEEQLIAYEASEEEVESVQSSAHEFMLALCCSFKTGIIFHDSSFGSSGKNLNHVLTNILSYMPRPHTNKLASEFVIAVLKTCPDQMVYYLPSLKGSYTPRISPLWLDAMNVLKKIIAAQDPISCLFKHEEKKSISALISIARSLCFPTVIAPSDISQIFKDGHPFICYHLCDFLTSILNKIKGLIDFCLQADFSKTSYSSADIATFHQSFLTTIMQDFTFLKDLGGLWEKLISSNKETSEEKVNTAMPVPSLSRQLLKILEVIQNIFSLSSRSYQEYDINIPKLFQSLKSCYSLLSREEICSLNLKLVDIISAQGEDVITLWNKNLTDSPLMFLLDVYSTTPPTVMVEDVSQILNKVLVHTKVFEFCPWETDVWLESMKSCRAKHVPFIIEFINEAMCTLLKNPNKFSDDIIETAEQKCNSQMTMDLTTVLNDLLSTEKDPILVEDFAESSNVSSTPKLNFSALVPAALFALKSVDDHKRKSCQSYVEKVLHDIMHHQYSPEILFSTIQKYKENLSSSLCDYFELLCPARYEIQKPGKIFDALECKEDLREHLKVKFVSLHALQNSSNGCHCDIQCESQNLQWKYKEKIIWQIITYLDWEITLFLEDKLQNTGISNYIHLLETLLRSSSQPSTQTDEVMEICESKEAEDESLKFKILQEIFSRPVILKLFLWTEKVPKSKKNTIQDFVQDITKLLLTLVPQVISQKDYHTCLIGLKDKVVKFNSFYFQAVNLSKNLVIGDNLDISHIISTFSSLLSARDITHMLEDMLMVQTEVKLEVYFSTLVKVFEMYIELNDFVLLSPNTINLLFEKYMDFSKKQKKLLREYIIKMFENHPVLASSVNAQSTSMLLKQSSSKNFYILGCLIDCNDSLRQNIQMSVIENLEELKNTPDFIYLASKCILNSALDESSDTKFLETVSLSYWEAVSNYLMMDIGSPDMLLENSAAGKAVQILFHQKILAMKKMSKFFKINADALIAIVPCPSKMKILLQFMEIWKNYISDSNKSFKSILKIAFHWLANAVSSFQSSTEFNYFPLVQFLCALLQSVSELDLADLVDSDTFFPKVLKIALKGGYNKSPFIETLTLLCKKSNILTVPTETIFNLVTSHSNFFNTMLSQVQENETLKEHVIDLLITLVKADKTLCKDNHLALLLASYTATLKSVDCKLLYLIKLYFESDIDVSKFSLLLWSKTALVYYSVVHSGAMHLEKKPNLQDLLNIFSLEMIESTVKNYPLTLKLEISGEDFSEDLTDNAELDKIYDLRFILPLLANVLSPGSFVHCRNFMDSNVLMLIFASLSSYDPDTRALGYYCLSQLYFHLEGANYREKEIWLCFLDSLRNSITSENPKIPSIVSLFLARVSHIFTKPDHPLYSVLYKFIMVKPNLDISHVPEFYRLFNSLDIEHRVERMWLLKLLGDGLRSSLDFHICEKRYIFNLLLTHYWSSISTSEEKIAILNILTAAAKVEASARFLVQNSLLSWLHNVIEETGSADVAISKSLCRLLKTLWLTVKKFFSHKSCEYDVEDSEEEKKNLHASFSKEFKVVFLKLPERLKFLDLSSVNAYLSTLHDILSFIKNCDGNAVMEFNLPLVSIRQMLDCWQCLSEKPLNAKTNNAAQFQEACTLFTKIFLLWSPDWKTLNNQCYRNLQLCVVKSIQLMLKFHDSSSDLPSWLYRCFKEDNRHGLVKLLFSSEGESCLKFILEFYEKSLNRQSPFTYNNPNDSKVSVRNQWRKIFLHFRKTCKSCNLVTELNLYNQIMMAS